MRNKGSKDRHGRYSTVIQMQVRAKRLAENIDKFIDQSLRQNSFNKITDFNKLHDTVSHLIDISTLKIDES